MSRILVPVLFALVMVFDVHPQSSEFEAHIFNNGTGFTLPYRFYIPKNIETGKKYPLVLFLHGAGDWGTNNSSQLANFPYHFIDATNSAAYPSYYLAPQCTKNSPWSYFPEYPDVKTVEEPTKSTSQVLALIDTLLHRDTVKIDPDRIYATGFSLGGEGVFDIITRAPDLFAAAVPICGIADTSKAELMRNTPLWIFHGSADDVNSVTYSRIIVEALNTIGVPPKYTEYEGYDHFVWDTAYNEPDLLPWLFSHGKPVATIKNSTPQMRNEKPVALVKINNALHIVWNPPYRPDGVELFSLNGKRLLMQSINPHDDDEYMLDLADCGVTPDARYIVRVYSGKKTVFSAIR